ncbi:MAG: adenosine kinase [Rhodospirillaceae bacterium]|nr:adenosine kinase [Rhodospirillaceae bacterium]
MNDAAFDVVGLGNAIVDVIAPADEAFIARQGLRKGGMTLADTAASEALYAAMGPATEMSGGSAANTMAGIASLGGRPAFFGRVRDDQLGAVFAHDIRAAGVSYDTPPVRNGDATGRCLILVTPDAERTMQTCLGAAAQFGPEDIDEDIVRRSEIAYLEGYLFDPPPARAAFYKAAEAAHAAGRKVALSLSDAFCVERHRAEIRDLVDGHIDILFANEEEIVSLYEARDFAGALEAVRGKCGIAALTRSEKGSVIVSGGDAVDVAPAPVAEVVDTTGAGDLYAAGFLHGLCRGDSLAECAGIGGLCAAEVISHFGARPAVPLRELVTEKLG